MPHIPWFQVHISMKSHQQFLKDVMQNNQWDLTASSTDLAEENPPEVSKDILERHTFQDHLKNGSPLSSHKSRVMERLKAKNLSWFYRLPPKLDRFRH